MVLSCESTDRSQNNNAVANGSQEETDMEDFWINMGLSVLFTVIKNPAKVKTLNSALFKLRTALDALPLTDPKAPVVTQ